MPIIASISREERRLMRKAIHKTRDKNHARRLTVMLMLHRGDRVSHVARALCCARSSVGRWINWFTLFGVEGLTSLPAGRSRRWPFEHVCTLLRELIKHSPADFGYQRSRWSTELLAIKIREITGHRLHAGTLRRWLPSAGLVWRRAAPTLRIRDPHKDEKMAVVERLWQALHDTVTRNHQWRSMWQLLRKVHRFMETVSPFPGGKHGLAKV